MKLPPAIDTVKMLREKTLLLETLKELYSTNNLINLIIKQTQKNKNSLNPLDQFYDFLKIKIKTVDPGSTTYQNINQAITNTHGPTHNKYKLRVKDIFELQRQEEVFRSYPFKKLKNKSKSIFINKLTDL